MSGQLSRRSLLTSAAVLPVLAVLGACSDSSGQAQAQSAPANAPRSAGTVDMDRLLQEGALPEKVLGEEDAPVTIVEYASMTCGHCGNFHVNTMPAIKENYIDTGQVRWIMREFPFDPRAEAAFMLARCSENNYFPMTEVLFQQQRNWVSVDNARDALFNIARMAGFTQETFEACLTDQELLNDVRAVRTRGADEFGVNATPTFFINGQKYTGALSVDEMSAIIDSML